MVHSVRLEHSIFENNQLLAMKIFPSLIFVSFTLLTATCSNKSLSKTNDLEKLFTIQLNNNGRISYQHLVLMEGLNKKNADSALILESVKIYLEKQKEDTPILSVEIFNSKSGYDPGESLSQSKEFYKSCVVTIWFDSLSAMPYKFYFYDENGEVSYEGSYWRK